MADQIGGALPAQMPPTASVGKTDKAIARSTANKIQSALKTTKDPQLKAEFANALATFHSYLAQDTKADKKGQGQKVSSKSSSRKK